MRTVIVPKVLTLDINKELKNLNYFSLGEVVKKNIFNENEEQIQVKIRFVKDPEEHAGEKMSNFSSYYKVGPGSILLTRKYAGITCKMLVKDLLSDSPEFYINKAYYKTIRFKVDNLYPPGVHIMDIIMLRMLKGKDLILHGASLKKKDSEGSFLILAPPDTGKTYTTYKLLELGYQFLGEDLSYYQHSTDSLMCVPFTSTWGHHFSGNKRLADKIPFAELFIENDKETVDDLFDKESVAESARLDRIYLIEKDTKKSATKINSSDQLLKKINSIQRNEFSYYKNPLLRAFEYQNNIDIDKISVSYTHLTLPTTPYV